MSQCDTVTQYQVTKCCLVRRLESAAKTPGPVVATVGSNAPAAFLHKKISLRGQW